MKNLALLFLIFMSFKPANAGSQSPLIEVWQYRMDSRLTQAKLYSNAIEFNQKKKALPSEEVQLLRTELATNPLWSPQTKGDVGCNLNSRWILKLNVQKQRIYCNNQKAIEALETWVGKLKLLSE